MIVLVMGVTGSGKTTVGTLLAQRESWQFADADSFHSPENVEKMRQGIPLTDADRIPWLQAIHDQMAEWEKGGINGVITCSALKRSYRELLFQDLNVKLVYLRGSADLIRSRLQHRVGHYAKANLVASQFADLEEPENAFIVDISSTPEKIVSEICERLGLA